MSHDYHPELNPDGFDSIELDAIMDEVDNSEPGYE